MRLTNVTGLFPAVGGERVPVIPWMGVSTARTSFQNCLKGGWLELGGVTRSSYTVDPYTGKCAREPLTSED